MKGGFKYPIILCILLLILKFSYTSGACDNPQDIARFKCWTNYTLCNADRHSIQICGEKCLTAPKCTLNCIVNKIVCTPGCASCFVFDIQCMKKNCIGICTLKPYSKECEDCSDKYCHDPWRSCVGPESVLPACDQDPHK